MHSCLARGSLGIVLMTTVFTVAGAKGAPAVCPDGQQPLDIQPFYTRPYTCGRRGVGRRYCPRTHYCFKFAICCPKPPCRGVTCSKECPEHKRRRYDRYGCRTCGCWDPCRRMRKTCPAGKKCAIDPVTCYKPPCKPRLICVPCPTCSKPCASDQLYRVGRQGCTICKCYRPCRYMKCGKGTNCAIVPIPCLIAPCPVHATCIPCPTPMCEKCKYGVKKPHRFKNGCELCPVCKDPCQRNRRRRRCPAGRRCLIDDMLCKKSPCPSAISCTACPSLECKGMKECTAAQTRIKDKDGCDTCGCRNHRHVCDDKRCMTTRQCVEEKKCGQAGCHLSAKCVLRCKGGQVWKNCGSACTKTCSDPSPACTEQCVRKCECPDAAPIWLAGKCMRRTDYQVSKAGLILHVPFDDHTNDISTQKAIGTPYGPDFSLENRNGRKVACFGGKSFIEFRFFQVWFADNHMDHFTISIWVKRTGDQTPKAGIVNNCDCVDSAGFEITAIGGGTYALVGTDTEAKQTDNAILPANKWVHLVWLYNGKKISQLVDGVEKGSKQAQGFMKNTGSPVRIAFCCGRNFFIGCLDDLRMYSRSLSDLEIKLLTSKKGH